MLKSLRKLACPAALAIATTAGAQTTTNYENGADGVTYQVTRRVVQRSIPTTEYQAREQKVYRPQVTTQYQTYQQNYVTPVTEYQWVPRLRNAWNPLAAPYWSHELTPVTRWESRPATVQIPVARTDWVEETRTTHVPVTTYRTVPEEHYSKVAVSVNPNGGSIANVASRPAAFGGQQLTKDPPSGPSSFAPASSSQSSAPTSPYGSLK